MRREMYDTSTYIYTYLYIYICAYLCWAQTILLVNIAFLEHPGKFLKTSFSDCFGEDSFQILMMAHTLEGLLVHIPIGIIFNSSRDLPHRVQEIIPVCQHMPRIITKNVAKTCTRINKTIKTWLSFCHILSFGATLKCRAKKKQGHKTWESMRFPKRCKGRENEVHKEEGYQRKTGRQDIKDWGPGTVVFLIIPGVFDMQNTPKKINASRFWEDEVHQTRNSRKKIVKKIQVETFYRIDGWRVGVKGPGIRSKVQKQKQTKSQILAASKSIQVPEIQTASLDCESKHSRPPLFLTA